MATLQPLSFSALALKPGLYIHYKGLKYQLLYVGRHSETLEEVVVYRAIYGSQDIWIRPLDMFLETVTLSNGSTVPRFKKIS